MSSKKRNWLWLYMRSWTKKHLKHQNIKGSSFVLMIPKKQYYIPSMSLLPKVTQTILNMYLFLYMQNRFPLRDMLFSSPATCQTGGKNPGCEVSPFNWPCSEYWQGSQQAHPMGRVAWKVILKPWCSSSYIYMPGIWLIFLVLSTIPRLMIESTHAVNSTKPWLL